MELTTRVVNLVTIVDVVGKVDTITAPALESAMIAMLDQGVKQMILNFEKIDYVSSSGFRVFLLIQKKLKPLGGQMVLQQVNTQIMHMFKVSGFGPIFKFTDSEQNSLAAF